VRSARLVLVSAGVIAALLAAGCTGSPSGGSVADSQKLSRLLLSPHDLGGSNVFVLHGPTDHLACWRYPVEQSSEVAGAHITIGNDSGQVTEEVARYQSSREAFDAFVATLDRCRTYSYSLGNGHSISGTVGEVPLGDPSPYSAHAYSIGGPGGTNPQYLIVGRSGGVVYSVGSTESLAQSVNVANIAGRKISRNT